VSALYLLPQGVYRAKAAMPRPGEGGRGFHRYEAVAPVRWPLRYRDAAKSREDGF
jgi:hypothetical protein